MRARIGWPPGTEQISCWITHTTDETAQIVRDNLHKSAMYSGEIEGASVRVTAKASKTNLFASRTSPVIFCFWSRKGDQPMNIM